MKNGIFVILIVVVFCLVGAASAANLTVKWDPVPGALGYRLYRSIDAGGTWIKISEIVGLSNVEASLTDQPDDGLVLYRVSAYNDTGESIRYWSGAWYCDDWRLPDSPSGNGIE